MHTLRIGLGARRDSHKHRYIHANFLLMLDFLGAFWGLLEINVIFHVS